MNSGPELSLSELFADFRPRRVDPNLTDFSRLRLPSGTCWQVAPRHADTVSEIVRLAKDRNIPLRLRAQGHSLNGASLPGPHELLLLNHNFRHVRFEEPGTVTVGSGVVLWVLQHVLRSRGFDLPVLNDGYPGPSVGGYVAAGGFGPRSASFGGFWDNVTEVRLVDGLGIVRRVVRNDSLFPWLFGSMGQLGVVIDAKLNIIVRDGSTAPDYPAGTSVVAPQMIVPKIPPEFRTEGDERLFWFTLFTPDAHLEEAHQELLALERKHRSALRFQERYSYPILQRGMLAPLVYPFTCAFTATGAWGWLTDASVDGVAALQAFDSDFMALATGKPYYRRYVQSELASGPDVYRRCFGAETYDALRSRKAEFDPARLFNRGTVFA